LLTKVHACLIYILLSYFTLQCNFFLAINLQCALVGIDFLCGNMLENAGCYLCGNMLRNTNFEGNDMGMWSAICFFYFRHNVVNTNRTSCVLHITCSIMLGSILHN